MNLSHCSLWIVFSSYVPIYTPRDSLPQYRWQAGQDWADVADSRI